MVYCHFVISNLFPSICYSQAKPSHTVCIIAHHSKHNSKGGGGLRTWHERNRKVRTMQVSLPHEILSFAILCVDKINRTSWKRIIFGLPTPPPTNPTILITKIKRKRIFEPVPIEIPASDNMVQAGKVHGNQDDPPKQFGENISFMN